MQRRVAGHELIRMMRLRGQKVIMRSNPTNKLTPIPSSSWLATTRETPLTRSLVVKVNVREMEEMPPHPTQPVAAEMNMF